MQVASNFSKTTQISTYLPEGANDSNEMTTYLPKRTKKYIWHKVRSDLMTGIPATRIGHL